MTKTFSFQQIAVPKVLSEEVREAISNNVLQFYVRDQQQEAQDEGITALYERLSQEDKLEGEYCQPKEDIGTVLPGAWNYRLSTL